MKYHISALLDITKHIFTVGDEGAVRSTSRFGDEEDEEKDEERWKFGSQQ